MVDHRNSASSVWRDVICEGHMGSSKRRRPSTLVRSSVFGTSLTIWWAVNGLSELRYVYSR